MVVISTAVNQRHIRRAGYYGVPLAYMRRSEAQTSIVCGNSAVSLIDSLNGVNCETQGSCTSYFQNDG